MSSPRRDDGRLPITIVGGFLGAGKSTWLRHQLHEGLFGSAHVIVNEAAETPVDNLLLTNAAHADVLAGGCACCDGREAFVALLRTICGMRDAQGAGAFDQIVLETSGLADPGAIATAISGDQMLARRLIVEDVIVLVDACHGAAQLSDEALCRAQIEAADRIIITKSDEPSARDTDRLIQTLKLLNPSANIEGAEKGVPVKLPAHDDATPYPLSGSGIETVPIKPHRLDISGGGGWASFSVWLSAVLTARGNDIVRVKGVVGSPDGRLLLQSVRNVVQPPEILPEPDDTGNGFLAPAEGVIVLIGRHIDEPTLERSWQKFVMGTGS
ncbi:MAG: GTP-binding protein [Rhizobiaceae bacterium]|nr:GTP-binding protein [Rhizobiaceae bacterium]